MTTQSVCMRSWHRPTPPLRHTLPALLLASLLLALSVSARKMGGFEARIFYPIDETTSQQQDQGTTASSVASASKSTSSAPAAARPFTLFDASDFAHLNPHASSPPSKPSDVEERTDLYLLAPDIPRMECFGLKLRGAAARLAEGKEGGELEAPSTFDLELKIRKGVSTAAGSDVVRSEDWKKIVKRTSVTLGSFADRELSSKAAPPVRRAFVDAHMKQKKRCADLTGALATELEARASGAAAERQPLHVVQVTKRRSQLQHLGGEQTDVDVRLVWSGGKDASSTSSALRTLHFRSICFEGSEGDTTSPQVRNLFQHIRQRHGGSDGDVSAASRVFTGGYPEFLLRVLNLRPEQEQPHSAASAAASSAKTVL